MPQEQLFVIFAYRAFALLKLGKEKEAAEILENLYKVRGGNEDQLSKLIEENLALSYLRLGERNNCVHNHSVGILHISDPGNGNIYGSLCVAKSHPGI